MSREEDPRAIARAIIGSGLYMVLGTADEAGNPWTSPVYYAHEGVARFLWVSSPESRHSRNIAVRPQVSLVIFSSGTPISTGQAVYAAAEANQATEPERQAGIELFSRRTLVHGGRAFAVADVTESAHLRLYLATVSEMWILEPGTDNRIPVTPQP
jgi:uncharacterized protein YhbP (UPF0306 family)